MDGHTGSRCRKLTCDGRPILGIPNEMPAVEIPVPEEKQSLSFWYNGVRYASPHPLVVRENTVYLPLPLITKLFGEAPEGVCLYEDNSVVTFSGNSITLQHAVWRTEEVCMVPAQYLAEVYGAKVWLDEAHDMLLVSTDKYKTDGILRNYGHVLVQNGEPFYEISFNMESLNRKIAADGIFEDPGMSLNAILTDESRLPTVRKTLSQLRDNGLTTIRIHCCQINLCRNQEETDSFFAAADAMYDLCDQYGIRVVACLGLLSPEFLPGSYVDGSHWLHGPADMEDLLCSSTGEARANVYAFIDAYVGRYKDRKTILMWEIHHEGYHEAELYRTGKMAPYSLVELNVYYRDAAERIRKNDPQRLVSSGDGMLHANQYHLMQTAVDGRKRLTGNWDTENQRLYCLALLHQHMDVISIHGNGVGHTDLYRSHKGNISYTTWELFLKEACRLGKPLYNGCAYPMQYAGELEAMIDAGVQLTHLQCGCAREEIERVGRANHALQSRWKINPLEKENTSMLYSTSRAESYDGAMTITQGEEQHGSNKDAFWAALALAGVALGAAAGVMWNNKKKKK